MSVSFSPSVNTHVEFKITCLCGAVENSTAMTVFPDYVSASKVFEQGGYVCDDPYCYVFVDAFNSEPEVNLSNGNAVHLLDVLGIQVGEDFSERCVGSMSAQDMLGRVLIALAVSPVSAEVPSYAEGNIIYGGRPEGYMQDKLESIRDVAVFAHANGRKVVWG